MTAPASFMPREAPQESVMVDNIQPFRSLLVGMAKDSARSKRLTDTYLLLDGRTVSLRGLTPRERSFLRDLEKMVRAEISYFEIERVALGPGSLALAGRNRVDERLATTPIYLAAEDIATRAGIEQGLLLRPEHHAQSRRLPEAPMVSVVQAAEVIGISRTAVYKAIVKGSLLGLRIGNVTVVDRASAEAYRAKRDAIGVRSKAVA
jgi:hypothetical protein